MSAGGEAGHHAGHRVWRSAGGRRKLQEEHGRLPALPREVSAGKNTNIYIWMLIMYHANRALINNKTIGKIDIIIIPS